jgi:catechol 2,3-dioxygenase-like lactoylglutathione lyase family enzyme
MDIPVTSTVVEIVAHDMERSLDFYRTLGLDVPEREGRTSRWRFPVAESSPSTPRR